MVHLICFGLCGGNIWEEMTVILMYRVGVSRVWVVLSVNNDASVCSEVSICWGFRESQLSRDRGVLTLGLGKLIWGKV